MMPTSYVYCRTADNDHPDYDYHTVGGIDFRKKLVTYLYNPLDRKHYRAALFDVATITDETFADAAKEFQLGTKLIGYCLYFHDGTCATITSGDAFFEVDPGMAALQIRHVGVDEPWVGQHILADMDENALHHARIDRIESVNLAAASVPIAIVPDGYTLRSEKGYGLGVIQSKEIMIGVPVIKANSATKLILGALAHKFQKEHVA